MDLRQYGRVLRAHWLTIAACVVVCVAAAAYLAWTRTPIYAANSQLFVSNGVPADLSQTYIGSLFTQQRVVSYAQIISSPPVARSVIGQLNLPYSVSQLRGEIRASVPPGTVLIDLSVRDRSPERARAIADAVGMQFARFVRTLETPESGQSSSVKVTVTSPAELPTEPASPRKRLYLVLGGLLGLVLGIGIAVLREAFHRRVRDRRDAEAMADAPVLADLKMTGRPSKRLPIVIADPASPAAEPYRQLRTNLEALGIEQPPGSFVVASPSSSRERTAVVANIGTVFAAAGYRVVLVDGNLREHSLTRALRLSPRLGLTDVLVENAPLDAALESVSRGLPLQILGAGGQPSNPSELLNSSRFANLMRELGERVDLIVLDSPPLLATSDAAVLTRFTAGALLVVRLGMTGTTELASAVQSMRMADARVLGLVLVEKKMRPFSRKRHSRAVVPDVDMNIVQPRVPVKVPTFRDG